MTVESGDQRVPSKYSRAESLHAGPHLLRSLVSESKRENIPVGTFFSAIQVGDAMGDDAWFSRPAPARIIRDFGSEDSLSLFFVERSEKVSHQNFVATI